MITEPMTMLTDYALAGISFYFAFKLINRSSRASKDWGLTLVVMGISAFVGGTSHGFANYLNETATVVIWKATTFLVGISVFFMLAGTFRAFTSPKTFTILRFVILVQLFIYLAWMTFHDEFKYVIYDYMPAMLVVLALSLWSWLKRNTESGRWLAWGVVVSLIAAVVQMSGFDLHRHFNHNDIFHVIQMGATWLFYRGGLLLTDRT